MKMARTIAVITLITLGLGCSQVTDKDLQDLLSQNVATKRDALATIAGESIFPKALTMDNKNEKKAVSIIQTLLTDEATAGDVEFNLLGLAALGRLAERVDVPVSVCAMKMQSENRRIRQQAVEVLGKIGNREAASLLIEMSADDPGNYAIIWALGETGDLDVVPTLNRMLGSDDEYVRYNAYNALSKIESTTGDGVREGQHEGRSHIGTRANALTGYKNVMSRLFREIDRLKKAWP